MDKNRLSRVLGLDYGERRIGLALSDPLGIIAKPFTIIDRKKTADHIGDERSSIKRRRTYGHHGSLGIRGFTIFFSVHFSVLFSWHL